MESSKKYCQSIGAGIICLYMMLILQSCDYRAQVVKLESRATEIVAKAVNTTQIRPMSAVEAETQFAEINGRKLAYRSIGKGKPIILCNRFRGILDDWDPAFIDDLAKNYQVIIFDYSGIGLSGGDFPKGIVNASKDVKDFMDFLGFEKIVIGGWSYGGFVAQTATTQYPEQITHTILIGTGPPGQNEFAAEQVFFDRALKPVNNLDDEIVLFFEPASEISVKAGKLSHERIAKRTKDKDIMVTPDQFEKYFANRNEFHEDKHNARDKLGKLNIPLLVISGDHEIVFPVQNWFVLNRKWPNLHLFVLPQSGHAPHHQNPQLSSSLIQMFIESSDPFTAL